MSSIKEFYIEKEKRELINKINSAKYVSEEQKEAMIGVMFEGIDYKHSIQKRKEQIRDYENELRDAKPAEKERIKKSIAREKDMIRRYEDELRSHADKIRQRDRDLGKARYGDK